MTDAAAAARARVLADHTDLVATVLDCADAVAAAWADEATADRALVVPPLRTALADAGVVSELPAVLADAVKAADCTLEAPPVAAPPYVAVTSRGPLLRATVDPGRLVVAVRAFEVERDPVRYRRDATTPAEAVRVELR